MTDTATQAADAAMAAANAANANAQYRAANGLPADQTNTTILNNPQSQQYLAQQDAARDAAKQAAAFSQPRNDLGGQQSAAFIAINNQYAQQQQNSIGSGGAYRQPTAAPAAANPYNPNSAAGIAYDVGLSGGNASPSVKAIAAQEGYVAQNNQQLGNQSQVAATRGLQAMRDMGFNVASDDTVIGRMNQYQQPERSIVSPIDRSSNAPTRAENLGYTKYDLTALDLAQSRSGYSNNLGDSKTRFIQQGLGAMQDMGFNVANPNTLNVLNLQRNAARQTPSTIDDRFYMNEVQKGVENYVETSSAYHHMGQDLGISIPANRFEYQGDLAVELLKGAPQKAGDWFSPASGEMSQSLIGGEGLQQYAWRGARDGTAIIAGVDFGAGIDKLLSAEGQYGPYNILYGAPGYRGTPSSQNQNGVQSYQIAALPVDYVPFGNTGKVGLSSGLIPSTVTGGTIGNTPVSNNSELPQGYGGFGVMAAGNGVNSVEKAGDYGLPRPFTVNANRDTVAPNGDIYGMQIPLASPILAFFEPGKQTTYSQSISNLPETRTLKGTETTPINGGFLTTNTYETTGGNTRTITATTLSTPSTFESMMSGAEKDASQLLWGGYSPKITTEQIKGEANLFAAVPGAAPFTIALQTPVLQDYAASYLKGEAEGVFNKPIAAGVPFVAGMGMGALFRGGEAIYGIGRAGIAEKVISEGGAWRGAEIAGNAIMDYGPKVLGGLYAVDVAGRSTNWGRDTSPAAAEKLGGIVSTEARPMFFGGLVGYAAPGEIYNAAKISNQGYLEALQSGKTGSPIKGDIGEPNKLSQAIPTVEGSTTGRFDYYINQPLKAGYENAISPITKARIEFPQFVEEAGESAVQGARAYAQYKIGNAYRSNVEIPVKTFTHELPGVLQSGQISILEPFVRARVEGVPKAQAALGRASIDYANWKYSDSQPVAEVIYGKYFDAKTSIPIKAEQGLVSAETSMWEFGQNAKTPGITLKSMLQESAGKMNPNAARDAMTWVKNPAKEISDYNKMVDFSKGASGNVKESGSTSSASKGSPFGSAPSGRIGTKVVGGKTVGGLTPEPSLRSQGISEPSSSSGKLGFAESHSTDFRGNPHSRTMKPMGKQSAGQLSIMSESLPVVEGMTSGRESSPQIVNIYPFSMTQQTQSYGVNAEFDVTQSRKQSREVMFSPQLEDISTLTGVTTARSQMQDVIQRQQQDQATTITSGVAQATRQSVSQERASLLDQLTGSVSERASRTERGSITSPTVAFDIANDVTTSPITSSDTRQTTDTRYDKIVTPIITTITDQIKIPLGGSLPFGGGGGGGNRTRKKRSVELFSFEMGDDTPVPTRFGLGGTTTNFVPGTRGIAMDILNPSDYAPNSIFGGMARRNNRDSL